MREISLVLGTAGHIDHGKTALINALTGINCDRLIEEKKRGITIELGFAPLKIDDDRVVSVIDVPGHEKFIRQMVAGASGIDAALLVIAADESVMPQTREHLAIMELLGVHDGLIAITKIDRIKDDEGMLDLVVDDVKEFVKGTFLEGKAIVPVSSITGENLDILRNEIKKLIDRVKVRARSGAFFLPVDRAFIMSGFGTVITGTAYHGTAHPNDKIEVLPSGRDGRIRTLQVHSRTVESAYAGQRVAVNLAGIDIDEISRGDVVCCKGIFKPTKCFEALISILPEIKEPLRHWQRVHVCTGTSEVLARVSLLTAKQINPGEKVPAQLVLEEPIVCTYGQRFIIRFYSPLITIGGGEIIFPYSYKPRGASARAKILGRIENLINAKNNPEKRFEYLINEAGSIDKSDAVLLIQDVQYNADSIAKNLISKKKIIELDNNYVSQNHCNNLLNGLVKFVKDYQSKYKSEAGMPIENANISRSLINIAIQKKILILENNKLHTPDFVQENDEIFNAQKTKVNDICQKNKWQLLTIDELKKMLNIPEKSFTKLIQAMKNAGELALIPGNYVLISAIENEMRDILRKLGSKVTLAQVRDVTGSTRKFILPILEYFDSKGYTRRAGDVRVVL
ncbi:MAG: selenocysteine-specific translation elongation factor [Synergistales bacterium]|nr:selenocysteine-specific translation elongation factor [Synergistales bacterium]MDY6401673.1 selenocysteine-specific translation elongation factor [Synergistales bacterium]MDY6404247.1 selenocysteine-specific translation elongation factor [Synergistales bacterium]MDY6411245.1 selenocysteine-specific translation elongation factor [Synergistales bacterium]MDY6415025.1 selenocysteine-specific translation elongation factor [Synergistales bacterium]